ncbi:dihydrodipicolinate synthase family protein [Phytohabitans sp. ZYX-F-186]|uniref:Dihydrodipicolinate synthase family protein n=1 Tax=Phytohabitans maris TaxID=3071409 RepID=A0ABU0ZG51_9ACTN|nr:dihydrodipicolinate synthase family protein [Phytohabitans sp. ZYX-F-186]MDQ7906046.1 dihydrodipicolinate synthase family protein [Phytohabitans sp. ZYX-F-186]
MIDGVVVAALTPFDEQGALDARRIPPYVDYLLDASVGGLMVGGTTGEFVTMTSDERIEAVGAFARAVAGRVPVIAHVGHAAPAEACRLAARAAEAGADALTAITPYFHPVQPAAVEAYFRDVAAAVPTLPFHVYNYPEASGTRIAPATFRGLLDVPNLAGVKLSVATFAEVEPYLDLLGKLTVMSGNDALIVPFAEAGGTAVVSGNASVRPALLVDLFAAAQGGHTAAVERLVAELDQLRELTAAAPDRLKAALRGSGVDIGEARIRTV